MAEGLLRRQRVARLDDVPRGAPRITSVGGWGEWDVVEWGMELRDKEYAAVRGGGLERGRGLGRWKKVCELTSFRFDKCFRICITNHYEIQNYDIVMNSNHLHHLKRYSSEIVALQIAITLLNGVPM